jgi:DNA-binding Lrp family transcriptional regulator
MTVPSPRTAITASITAAAARSSGWWPTSAALAVPPATTATAAYARSTLLLPGTDSDEFATLSDRLAPVNEVLHLAGTPDYLLRVACRDTAELDALLRTLRLRLGVADTDTKIILRSGPPPV